MRLAYAAAFALLVTLELVRASKLGPVSDFLTNAVVCVIIHDHQCRTGPPFKLLTSPSDSIPSFAALLQIHGNPWLFAWLDVKSYFLPL